MPEILLAGLVTFTLFGLPIISGMFARSTGRSFWKWFLIGCILPVISCVIIFILDGRERRQQNK